MTWHSDDVERTALHEAGHAVVCWSYGRIMTRLHLDDVKEGGQAHFDPDLTLDVIGELACCLAGYEAEQLFKPPGRRGKAGWDFLHCVPIILRMNGASEDEPEEQALREQGRICAENRLLDHEARVRLVARYLIEHRHMNRDTFEVMMQQTPA